MSRPALDKLGLLSRRQALGWGMLACAALIGLWTIRWGLSDVEGDALVTGFHMSKGRLLYRDIFSHHFPFIYFWSTASVALFGKSLYLHRLTVWLFQLVVFGVVMVLSRQELTIGITSLIWSILRHLYLNNILVYQAFSAPAVIGIGALVLYILLQRDQTGFRHYLAIGLLASVSVLSDPLTIYPVGVALVLLWLRSPRIGFQTSLVAGACAVLFLGYLLLTGALTDFLSDALRFNSEIYARYNNNFASPWRFSRFSEQLLSGFGITNRQFLNLDPFREITTQYTDFDRWLFTGFLYRIGALSGILLFLVRKETFAAFFLYTYCAGALAIEVWGHRAVNFVPLALFIAAGMISQEWWPAEDDRRRAIVRNALTFAIGSMFVWLGFRVIVFTHGGFDEYAYIKPIIAYRNEARELVDLACGQDGVQLIFYPNRIYPYFFAEMEAVAGYYYMWPWVAEIALDEVVEALERPGVLVIAHRQLNGLVFQQYDTREYLKPLDDYLMNNYIAVDDGLYISPALAARCAAQGHSSPPLRQMRDTGTDVTQPGENFWKNGVQAGASPPPAPHFSSIHDDSLCTCWAQIKVVSV
ncbi:MAG TPA: hypothetical protein VMN57_15430 [Anaerolineales bacterium]|nr:hypothetical protein [Anaerolineales bacterium]